MVRLPHPILTNTQLDLLCNIRYKGFKTVKLQMTFDCPDRGAGRGRQSAQGSQVTVHQG